MHPQNLTFPSSQTQKLRNAIGTHNGSYSVYRSIAVAAGKMDPLFKPDLHNTAPPVHIPPNRECPPRSFFCCLPPLTPLARLPGA